MLGKLLLVNQRELELVMINMTNAWLKVMNHVETIDVCMHSPTGVVYYNERTI